MEKGFRDAVTLNPKLAGYENGGADVRVFRWAIGPANLRKLSLCPSLLATQGFVHVYIYTHAYIHVTYAYLCRSMCIHIYIR